jgi:hypothetical protein
MLSQNDINKHTKYINRLGLTVIKLPPEITDNFNSDVFLREQKEYLNPDPDEDNYILGGFKAYGNGSSYHHPEVRRIREAVYQQLLPLFQALHGTKEHDASDNYIEMLADRFARRNKSVPVTNESWHRDATINYKETNKKNITNIIYGGWINLDKDQTQYFSFVPGSHKGFELKAGFAKISKEEAELCEDKKRIVTIPPYHCIVFNELLRHEVIKIKHLANAPQFSVRLYHKYRISNAGVSLLGEETIRKIIQDQSPFNLHHNSLPPMYAKMHLICWRQRLVEFSKNIRPVFKSKTNRGDYIVNRSLTGLRQAGLELFPDYTANEIAILLPRRL